MKKSVFLLLILVLSFGLMFGASNDSNTYSVKSSFGGGISLLNNEDINSTFADNNLPELKNPIFSMVNSSSFILDNRLALIMDSNVFMNLSGENDDYYNRFVGVTFTGGIGYNIDLGSLNITPNFGLGIGSQIFFIQKKNINSVEDVLATPGNSTILYSMEVPLKVGFDLGFNINRNRHNTTNLILKTDYFFNIANLGWSNNITSMLPTFLENNKIENKLEGLSIALMFEVKTDF